MKTLEQPPPGPDFLEERPPEGWKGVSHRAFWTTAIVLGVFGVLGILVAFPLFFRGPHHGAERTRAISNSKQVGLALLEFDQEYGCYPSEKTAAEVKRVTGTKLDLSGTSSNAMFRQLIAFGINTEDIFYARHPEGFRRSDKNVSPGKALEPGEVGFSYVYGLDTSMDAEMPLLLTPMVIGTNEAWINKRFGGQAVVLRVDNSARTLPIRESDRKIMEENGIPLLDAAQPYMKGKWPDIRHPEK